MILISKNKLKSTFLTKVVLLLLFEGFEDTTEDVGLLGACPLVVPVRVGGSKVEDGGMGGAAPFCESLLDTG